ncbi:ribosome maturation factor RimM [Gardnerella swidsinskii]|jgi:16S rRNA processing protein rimM|uniref:Ribosome maturation factor RimM n=1 Tax=Gardnerella swidsinskii TaxID=2792979 RepID=A0A9X7FFP6_9BIFI|nr:ribosome maturation factor RimM [Gardnerella swidsinskii]ADB13624.1 16S rRNA processing protein RimM [Gardnerella vaginalis 409-05]NSX40565.1 ribosome maturation factor RimM [Gardnerella vaginalis]MDK8691937.1 ribosome maturation factor RimM [Gardnerella swidsinskii]PMC44612.1 ribosome maturation factor RimM [Gardnerella vaginalis]PMC55111.1 ribosome maturation factor RimM [Gardnerella swidsinskii]
MNVALDQQSFDNPQQSRNDLLRVCRIGKAQGLKGEVTVQIFTDEPYERFEPGNVLCTADGEREFVIENARTFKNRWILLFEESQNRNDAEALNGTELYVHAEDAQELAAENAWYIKDLVGLQARLCEENQLGLPACTIGKVVDVLDGAQSLLKIRLNNPIDDDNKTALVPFVEALVPEVDVANGYLTIDPPGGLIPGLS